MDKNRTSRILVRAGSKTVCHMARELEEKYEVTVLKEPSKTLVMLPLREPVRGTPFYIGELLACEAMVEMAGAKGVSLCIGDDKDMALAMAVIDAAYNAGVPECLRLDEMLEALEILQAVEIGKDAALHKTSRVSFETLEGNT